MNIKHVKAVFKAEYYTTTSKFRSYRKYVPFLFLIGVFGFSYLLRTIYEFFRGDQIIENPPIPTFFSIIAIFSYFTLFAPLLSPLGRVVYDGGARSRREVALNSPVQSKDLMYGNLLSNLAFFLPFFGFVGTLTLAPFIGTGIYSPLATSVALFGILSLLILTGLVAGTLLSPIIFGFISSRKNSETRAFVAFSVSAMLVFSLPLLRYYLENTTLDSGLGIVTYLPFTLAAILIIYVLYGVSIAIAAETALILLIASVLILFLLGYFSADTIYDLSNENTKINTADPDSKKEKLLDIMTYPFPLSITRVVKATMKASLRDIEHLARLTIGLSITVFMIFALSSRGLFRTVANFDEQVELAVVIFALILSSASVIFIEASSFTVQHRDMFALIKSAPDGARKFVVGKAFQMILLLVPVFLSIILVLSGFGFISSVNILPLGFVIFLVLILMTTLSLAIYLLNPSDNEEDLGNFLNLLVFYLISFLFASVPVFLIIRGTIVNPLFLTITALLILLLSSLFLYIAFEALEQLNLETLDSPLSISVLHVFKTLVVFVIVWNFLPLFAVSYLLQTSDVFGFILLTYLIIFVPILIYYLRNVEGDYSKFTHPKNFILTVLYVIVMILTGTTIILIWSLSGGSVEGGNLVFASQQNFSILHVFLIIILASIVEELFFRGFLLDYSEQKLSKRKSMLLISIIFGFIHIYPIISMVNALIQSVILIQLKRKTDTIFYPVVAHLCYNLIIVSTFFIF